MSLRLSLTNMFAPKDVSPTALSSNVDASTFDDFSTTASIDRVSPSLDPRAVPVKQRFKACADTLFYTMSDGDIAKRINDDLDSEEMDEKDPDAKKSVTSFTSGRRDVDLSGLDGGYAWFVALGAFMSHFVEGGFERGEGIFLLVFLKRFQQSKFLTTVPGSMASTLRFLFSPLASAVCNRFSIRTSVMVGAIIFTSGVFLSQFAEDFYVLVLTFGVLGGMGRALFSGPGLIVLGLYFRKRQGIASGCATSGVGFGSFFLVPLISTLFQTYDFQGALLILSAVCSHMIVVAMLYRPLSRTKFFLAMDAKREKRLCGENNEVSKGGDSPPVTTRLENVGSVHPTSVGGVKNVSNSSNNVTVTEPPTANDKNGVLQDEKSSCCNNTFCQICFPLENANKDAGADPERHRIVHFYLLKHAAFSFYCVTIFLFTASLKTVFTFFPSHVISRGHGPVMAALLLSIAGPFDTTARICIGLLVDVSYIRPYRLRMFNFMLVALSICTMLLPATDSTTSIGAVLVIYTTFSGMCFATRTLVLIDLLGVRRLANSFGLLMFFQGFATLSGPPFAGWILDHFGSVDHAYYFASSVMAVAAGFMHFAIAFHYKYGAY